MTLSAAGAARVQWHVAVDDERIALCENNRSTPQERQWQRDENETFIIFSLYSWRECERLSSDPASLDKLSLSRILINNRAVQQCRAKMRGK